MLNIKTEKVTPREAEEYLKTNEGNRPINQSYVRSYADTMKAGKWMLNGVGIVFDYNGKLIDGQHRLLAVIKAQVPVEMTIVRGADPDCFTTFDCGRRRNLGQLLAMQGMKHYNSCASIVIAAETLRRHGRFYANNSTGSADNNRLAVNQDLYEIYERDKEGYTDVTNKIRPLATSVRILEISKAGGLFYHLTRRLGHSEDKVWYFFEQLFSLDKSENPAIELLRIRLIREQMSKISSLSGVAKTALLFKAWNAYISGKELRTLKFDQESEPFPSLL